MKRENNIAEKSLIVLKTHSNTAKQKNVKNKVSIDTHKKENMDI